MDLELSEDQVELAASAAGALDRHSSLALARDFLEGAGDATPLWAELAQLGWYGIALDGGEGFGAAGLCLIADQLGRHAAPTTIVDTAVLVAAAAASDGPAMAWAQRLADGAATATLALLEPAGDWLGEGIATVAERDGERVRLSGSKCDVHHAHAVGRLGVVASLEGEPVIALVPRAAAGVALAPVAGIDPSCAAATVDLDGVEVAAEDLIAGPAVAAALREAALMATAATAAEAVGACSAALDLALAHSLAREQFGRPIAGFQALRHLLAEAHLLRETAWASVLYAGAALDERVAGAPAAVAVAKAQASTTARQVCEQALQIFGGVGFTREHDFHLLYRRAIACEQRFGDAGAHERRIAATLISERTLHRVAEATN